MRLLAKLAAVAASVSLIVACGGGGGGGSTTNASAEGVWTGTTSAGFDLNVLVLENNEVLAIFGQVTNDVFGVVGFNRGSGIVNGTNLRGNGTEYVFDGSVTAGTLNATINEGLSLNGTVVGASSVTFQTTPLSGTYNYNTAAQLSDAEGVWSGELLNGDATSVTISSNGSIVGVSNGCNFSGTTTPRASGKNVFNTQITFAGSPCALPGQTVSGFALAYPITNNTTQLLVAVTNSQNTAGTVFFAQRPNGVM